MFEVTVKVQSMRRTVEIRSAEGDTSVKEAGNSGMNQPVPKRRC